MHKKDHVAHAEESQILWFMDGGKIEEKTHISCQLSWVVWKTQ